MSGFETDDLFSQKTIGLDHQLGMERKEEVWEAGGSARCRIVFSLLDLKWEVYQRSLSGKTVDVTL